MNVQQVTNESNYERISDEFVSAMHRNRVEELSFKHCHNKGENGKITRRKQLKYIINKSHFVRKVNKV